MVTRYDIEMYSTRNEGKSFLAERFIRTLRNKIYKYRTSISKNLYIDKLDDIVNKWNNTNHSTIKTTYIDFGIKNNDKDPEFKVGDHVRTIKIFLQKVTLQIGVKTFLQL